MTADAFGTPQPGSDVVVERDGRLFRAEIGDDGEIVFAAEIIDRLDADERARLLDELGPDFPPEKAAEVLEEFSEYKTVTALYWKWRKGRSRVVPGSGSVVYSLVSEAE